MYTERHHRPRKATPRQHGHKPSRQRSQRHQSRKRKRHNRLPSGTDARDRHTHRTEGHALLAGCAWKRQARPQAAGQALQRLLQGWLRSTLKGRRENPGEKARGSRGFSTECTLQHKFHLLNMKAAENKTPLYKDREQRTYTWAHSNTLHLRNSPGKAVAQCSAAREEQRLPAQPWARRGGQAALRTPRKEEGACKHRGLLSDQGALRAPREAATRGQNRSAHTPGQEPPSQPPAATAALSSTPTKGAPARGAWLPGPSAGRGGASCLACALPRGSRSPPPMLVSVCTQVGFWCNRGQDAAREAEGHEEEVGSAGV